MSLRRGEARRECGWPGCRSRKGPRMARIARMRKRDGESACIYPCHPCHPWSNVIEARRGEEGVWLAGVPEQEGTTDGTDSTDEEEGRGVGLYLSVSSVPS